MTYISDTIIALSTPPGIGAIGVIRLSGAQAIELVDQSFSKALANVEGHTAHFGKIIDKHGRVIDEVVATIFRAPKSYTKENVVEISCHGSPYILNEVIQLLIRNGARQAKGGEFTLRAFLNGQMDLSQAEAVADLIASDSASSHDLAMRQMRGGFRDKISELRQELMDFASLIELELDFSEEDVEFADRSKLKSLVVQIKSNINMLVDSFNLGNVIKSGISTVIAGKPNAGKSTLLNALLSEDRAIVSDIAGTTRDTIEASMNISGLQFRFVDTAGIRSTTDTIESIGVEKTMEAIQSSTLVIYVVDVITMNPEELKKALQESKSSLSASKLLVVLNKMDLNPYTEPESYYVDGLLSKDNVVSTSAINGMNIEYLKERLYQIVLEDQSLLDDTIVTNVRHYEALTKALDHLVKVEVGLETSIPSDLIAMDIRQGLHYLGEITGEISTDDLLGNIFGKFCIGK